MPGRFAHMNTCKDTKNHISKSKKPSNKGRRPVSGDRIRRVEEVGVIMLFILLICGASALNRFSGSVFAVLRQLVNFDPGAGSFVYLGTLYTKRNTAGIYQRSKILILSLVILLGYIINRYEY